MPISLVQQGILAEFLFNVLAVLGSDGCWKWPDRQPTMIGATPMSTGAATSD
jgi:hypothetical protein